MPLSAQRALLLAQDSDSSAIFWIIVFFIIIVFGLVVLAIFARYFRLWIQAVTTRARITIFDLLGMTFRKVNPSVIVRSKVMAVQAGLDDSTGITSRAMEAHYLAGGNVPLVIRACIAARKARIIDLDFKQATAIDLAVTARLPPGRKPGSGSALCERGSPACRPLGVAPTRSP